MPSTKFILAVFILICGFGGVSNNVLNVNNFSDSIYLSDFKSDAFLDSLGFLEKYGYPAEKVSITSEDGYITNMFRIPKKGPPVLLVHGITDSSDEWLVLGPERSLAYLLSDKGFDVWIFNYRGNRYSKGHTMNITKKQYWDFSYEEIATNDMPAAIDHILNVTSQEKLSYIGFSQGTTIFFVMCSMLPDYNKKIQVPILLAPVAWLSNIKMPIVKLVSPNIKLLESISNIFGLYEIFPFDSKRAFQSINCRRNKPAWYCNLLYYLNFGLVNSKYLSPDKITVIDSHVPAGVSAKNLIHCIQGYNIKRFQRFDYGVEKNLKIYSSRYPPVYDVKLVTVPVNIIASESDWISHYKDVNTLMNKLPNVKRFILYNSSYELSHLEFVFGSRVKSLINDPVVSILMDDLNKQ